MFTKSRLAIYIKSSADSLKIYMIFKILGPK